MTTPTKGRPSLQSFSNPTTDNYFQTIILRGDDDWKKGHRTKTSAPTLTPTEGKQEALSPTEANTAHSNENSSHSDVTVNNNTTRRRTRPTRSAQTHRRWMTTREAPTAPTRRFPAKTRAPTSTIAPTANDSGTRSIDRSTFQDPRPEPAHSGLRKHFCTNCPHSPTAFQRTPTFRRDLRQESGALQAPIPAHHHTNRAMQRSRNL